MIVTCDSCSSSFNLDGSLLKPAGSMVRCSNCKHVFKAYPETPAPKAPAAPQATEVSAPPEEKKAQVEPAEETGQLEASTEDFDPQDDGQEEPEEQSAFDKPDETAFLDENQTETVGAADDLSAKKAETIGEIDFDDDQIEAPSEVEEITGTVEDISASNVVDELNQGLFATPSADEKAADQENDLELDLDLDDGFGPAPEQIVLEVDAPPGDLAENKTTENDIEELDLDGIDLDALDLGIAPADESDEVSKDETDELGLADALKEAELSISESDAETAESADDDLGFDMELDLEPEVDDAQETAKETDVDIVQDENQAVTDASQEDSEAIEFDLDLDLDDTDIDAAPDVAKQLELDLVLDEDRTEAAVDEQELDLDLVMDEDGSNEAGADVAGVEAADEDAEKDEIEDFEFDLDFDEDVAADEDAAETVDDLDLEPVAESTSEKTEIEDDAADEFDFDLDLDETVEADPADTDEGDVDAKKPDELGFDLEAVSESEEDETPDEATDEGLTEDAAALATDIEEESLDFGLDDIDESSTPEDQAVPTEAVDEPQEALLAEIDDDVLMEDESDQAFTASPVKKKKVSKSILIILILAILAGAGSGAYWLLKQKNIKIPYVSDLMAPKAADPGKLNIDFFDIDAKFITNQKAGKLFVISGKVKNGYKSPRSFISITGKLYQKDKKLVKTSTVYCGNTLPELELMNLEATVIAKRLGKLFGDRRSNVKVAPGKVLPFMVVFTDVPENLEEYTIEVAGSSPAGQ
jgi:pilus assembly protein FimV